MDRCLFSGAEATQQVMMWKRAHLCVNTFIHRRLTQSGQWRRPFEGTSTVLLHSLCASHAPSNTCCQIGNMLFVLWSTSVPPVPSGAKFQAVSSGSYFPSRILPKCGRKNNGRKIRSRPPQKQADLWKQNIHTRRSK